MRPMRSCAEKSMSVIVDGSGGNANTRREKLILGSNGSACASRLLSVRLPGWTPR